MKRKIPGYRKIIKNSTNKAVDDLEEMFKKQWENAESDMKTKKDQ